MQDEELKVWCKTYLSNYKVAKVMLRLDAMPLLPNGKLDKSSLERRARDAVAA